MTRRILAIPEKTDRAVRTFLQPTSRRKSDLPRFVDESVSRRALDLTVREIEDRSARRDK